MSVDNFRVYDIRVLPVQEVKTIYDARDITKLDNVDVTKTLFALQDATGVFTSPFTLGIKDGTCCPSHRYLGKRIKIDASSFK